VSVNEALRVVGERWRVVLSCLLLGLLGAALALTVIPRQYSASVTLYVSLQGRATSSDEAYQASQLAKERAASYAPLMTDGRITQAVVDQLKLPMTAEQLAERLTVTVAPETVVLTASVTDTSPDQAAAIANAVAEQFVGLTQALEQQQPIGPAPAPAPEPEPATRGAPAPAATPAPASAQIGTQIIRLATPSAVPVSPNGPFAVALGAALGLLIGIGAAFVQHVRDTSIRDRTRLQALTGVPLLAEIPADRNARMSPIAVDQDPGSRRAEAYRRLRTNLQFHGGAPKQHGGAKVVVVTSAVPGEGTSATACNLARALAEGNQVLLIDANLRHPQVETYLDLDPGPGLTTVLAGRLLWPFARRRLGDLPLEVLPAGPVAPRMGELLAGRGLDNLLHEVRDRYDFVIIDVPALLPVSDAAAVAARADEVVLVVRYRRTNEDQVAAALRTLDAVSAPLIGTVLSMAKRPPRGGRMRGYPDRPVPLIPQLSIPTQPGPAPNGRPVAAAPGGPVPVPVSGEVAEAPSGPVAVPVPGSREASATDRTAPVDRGDLPPAAEAPTKRPPSPSPNPRR
jgi:capsular exopolysaccharide synthesis family protein